MKKFSANLIYHNMLWRCSTNCDGIPTEDDVVKQLFTHEVFMNMVTQTNLYAAQWLDRANLEPGARIHGSIGMIQIFIRWELLLRGVLQKGLAPRNQVRKYFDTSNTKPYFWL